MCGAEAGLRSAVYSVVIPLRRRSTLTADTLPEGFVWGRICSFVVIQSAALLYQSWGRRKKNN